MLNKNDADGTGPWLPAAEPLELPDDDRYARRVSNFAAFARPLRGRAEPPPATFARETVPVHVPSIRPPENTPSDPEDCELVFKLHTSWVPEPESGLIVDPYQRPTLSVAIKPPPEAMRASVARHRQGQRGDSQLPVVPSAVAAAARGSVASRASITGRRFTPRQTIATLFAGVTIGIVVSLAMHRTLVRSPRATQATPVIQRTGMNVVPASTPIVAVESNASYPVRTELRPPSTIAPPAPVARAAARGNAAGVRYQRPRPAEPVEPEQLPFRPDFEP